MADDSPTPDTSTGPPGNLVSADAGGGGAAPPTTTPATQSAGVSDFATALGEVDPLLGRVQKSIETVDEPRANAYDRLAQAHLKESEGYSNRIAELSEQMALQVDKEGAEATKYLDQTPSRQGIYAQSMHVAPLLAVLTAIGGAATRASGLQMLAATNGIVQGVNAGNEQAYQAAVDKWKLGYEKFQQQAKLQEQHYNLMLKAYSGRADAEEKAALAAERMAGNIRSDEQKKLMTAVQAQKAQMSTAMQLEHLEMMRQGLELRRQQLGLLGQGGQGAPMTADGKTPYQVLWDIDAAHVKLQGARGERIMAIAAGIQANPEMSSQDLVDVARRGQLGMLAQEWMSRVTGRRIAGNMTALNALTRDGGLYDQLDTAAQTYANTLTGLSGTQIAQQVERALSTHVYTSKEMQAYVTKLEETRTELAQGLSRGSSQGATDFARRQAEDELPAWKGVEALRSGIQASKEVNQSILDGDYDLLDQIQSGKSPRTLVNKDGSTAKPAAKAAPGRGPPQVVEPTIATKEQYDRLDPGSWFIGADGKRYQKPQGTVH